MRQSFAITLIIAVLFGLWLVNTGRWARFAQGFRAAWDNSSAPGGYNAPGYTPPAGKMGSDFAPSGGGGGGGIDPNTKRQAIAAGLDASGPIGQGINAVAAAFGIKW